MRQLVGGWLLSMSIGGCASCEEAPGLQVAEPFPHTRCLVSDPPPARAWQVSGLSLSLQGRELTVAGAPDSVRIAAFAGPGLARPASPADVAALAEREPTIAVMLGGLGDDDATASETIAALSAAPFPILFVPGGRDDLRRLQALLGRAAARERERIVNLAAIRRVSIGPHELIPVPGAADGRYALDAHGCGFSLPDLQAIAAELPAPGRSRFLLAWQAPGRGGPQAVATTAAGLDLGSDDLAEFARRVDAPGGLFAWPTVRIAEPVGQAGRLPLAPDQPARDLRLVVPRITGRPVVAEDGARVPPGFVMMVLDDRGLRLLGRVPI